MTTRPPPDALVVSQYYWPEPIGSAPYCRDLAEWLAASGWSVRVLTCRPHYPQGVVPECYRNRARDSESWNGVSIERVPPWRPHRRGAFARMVADFAFLARGLMAVATGRVRRADLVISLCPSILSVLLGAVIRRRGGHHVAVVHDIQSGLAAGLGMVGGRRLLTAIRILERSVLNRVDQVFVLSEQMRARLRQIGVRTPIEILPIWVDGTAIRPLDRPPDSDLTALYSGNLGRKQALDQLVSLAEILQERGSRVHVVIRGEGSDAERLKRRAAALDLPNLRFSQLVPDDRLAEGLAEGDIHLVPQDGQAADYAVPSKVYGIMAAGRTFVATAEPGSHLWTMQETTGAFRCVPPGDPEALADEVLALEQDTRQREELGSRGRAFVMAHHDKAAVLASFAAAMDSLVAAGSGRRRA